MNDETIEVWLQHPECPTYWFSSLGRIERRKNGKSRLLRGTTAGQNKYVAVDMFADSKTRVRRYLHRVVCELFNGNPPFVGAVCRHLDTDKNNNASSNLAWGTVMENVKDGLKAGKIKRGEENHMAKLTRAVVVEMRRIREETGEFYHLIARRFGVTRMTAWRAINGAHWNV